MSTQVRSVIGGPDRFGLATRLFEGSNENQPLVFFKVTNRLSGDKHEWEEAVKLDSATRNDPTGNHWKLTGHNLANKCKVEIIYSLQHRSGVMTIFIN